MNKGGLQMHRIMQGLTKIVQLLRSTPIMTLQTYFLTKPNRDLWTLRQLTTSTLTLALKCDT